MSSDEMRIRLGIVDDNERVRTSLKTVFEALYGDIEVVGDARNGYEAITLCQKIEVDVLLMDLLMPEMDGITAYRLILERFPHIHIVVLTSATDYQLIEKALQTGASSYVSKSASVDELYQAISKSYNNPI